MNKENCALKLVDEIILSLLLIKPVAYSESSVNVLLSSGLQNQVESTVSSKV